MLKQFSIGRHYGPLRPLGPMWPICPISPSGPFGLISK